MRQISHFCNQTAHFTPLRVCLFQASLGISSSPLPESDSMNYNLSIQNYINRVPTGPQSKPIVCSGAMPHSGATPHSGAAAHSESHSPEWSSTATLVRSFTSTSALKPATWLSCMITQTLCAPSSFLLRISWHTGLLAPQPHYTDLVTT